MRSLTFDTFKPEYSKAFKQLNIDWLEEYFYVEAYDHEVLKDPQRFIIDRGGHIFVAKINREVIGVAALMPAEDATYELAKMAVDTAYRGQKVGQQLLEYTLSFAKEKLISTLLLYSNRKLENAIYIYRKHGFKEIPLESDNPYLRADIKMKLKL